VISIPEILRRAVAFGANRQAAHARCRVLFVCTGNICRSPTAEAVFRYHIEVSGLREAIHCASAGTHDFNVGGRADGRSQAVAAKRGYDLSRIRGRRVSDDDFVRYDLILAMDRQNIEALRARCPPQTLERIKLLMEFARKYNEREIPDPYYSNTKGFELVLDMIEDACTSLLEHVRANHLADPGAEPGIR